MAHAIADNKSLTLLDVGGNNIGPKGVGALAAALRNHGSLASLELGYNPLGAEGTKTVTELAKFGLPKVGAAGCSWVQGCSWVHGDTLRVRGQAHRHSIGQWRR
jgi:hypothetical protein